MSLYTVHMCVVCELQLQFMVECVYVCVIFIMSRYTVHMCVCVCVCVCVCEEGTGCFTQLCPTHAIHHTRTGVLFLLFSTTEPLLLLHESAY